MDQATHNKIVSFIWGITDDVLRDHFNRNMYPDVVTAWLDVREATEHLPDNVFESAAELDVSTAQIKVWLARLVAEGVLDKRSRPVAYVVRQAGLFASSLADETRSDQS